MAAFGLNRLLFGENENENEKPAVENMQKPLTFQDFYKALDKDFYGMDNGVLYKYHLDMNKLRNATLSDIVNGITTVENRDRKGTTPNQIANNPSITINQYKVTNPNGEVKDNMIELINRLSELKQFIIVDNNEIVDTTRLSDLLPKPTSRAPVTPRRFGGRHTKHAKRSKRSKHTKRSKRTKHTMRRKH